MGGNDSASPDVHAMAPACATLAAAVPSLRAALAQPKIQANLSAPVSNAKTPAAAGVAKRE
jgi:hypothetical protein